MSIDIIFHLKLVEKFIKTRPITLKNIFINVVKICMTLTLVENNFNISIEKILVDVNLKSISKL